MADTLRLYSFVCMYLSGIHAGIQTGHAAVTLTRKYTRLHSGKTVCEFMNRTHKDIVEDWVDNHNTFIVLNGGYYVNLVDTLGLIEQSGFPFSPFFESHEALNGLMTSVAVILPESFYELQKEKDPIDPELEYYWRNDGYAIPKQHHLFELLNRVKSSKLAS